MQSNKLKSNPLTWITLFALLLIPNFSAAHEIDINYNLNVDCQKPNIAEKDDFKVVTIALEALKINRQAYLNNFWTTLGFFAVALGWMLTSSETKTFFSVKSKSDTRIFYGILLVIVLFAIHLCVLIYTYAKSSELFCVLYDLNEALKPGNSWLPKELVEYYKIPIYWPVVDGLIILILVLFIKYVIKSCKMEE